MSTGSIRKVLFAVIALASIAFVSCKKDKSDPPAVTKKLSRVEEDGKTLYSFTYNADGTLKTVTAAVDGGTPSVFTIKYDGQKKPIEITSSEGYTMKHVYQNGQLALTENFENGQKVSENFFQYEGGKIKSNTLLMGAPNNNGGITYTPVYRAIYAYYANGSVQSVSTMLVDPFDGDLSLHHKYVYQQYDDKKNPFQVMSDFSQVVLFTPVHSSNPVIEKLYDADDKVEESIQNVYTYDAAGYTQTLKSTITPVNGAATVKNIKFIY